jgi:hypothetical protein
VELGSSLHLSNIYEIIQKISGVDAVRIEYFDKKEEELAKLKQHIPISSHSLASIDVDDIILQEKIFNSM